MKLDIDTIFLYLSWYNDPHKQHRGIEEAKRIKHLSVLIMPIEGKHTWENCSKVLASKCDSELEPYYYQLFEWFQDMNWPGADVIYNRLLNSSGEAFVVAYQHCLAKARALKDWPWENALQRFGNEKGIAYRGQGERDKGTVRNH